MCDNNDIVKCPKCKNLYNDSERKPRILLQCGHSICSKCINDIIENNKDNIILFQCPEDSKEYKDIKNIDDFPINHSLLNILKKLQRESFLKQFKLQNENINIENITNENLVNASESNSKCCKENLTDGSVKNYKIEKEDICKRHPGRKLEVFCLAERTKICALCALEEDHKDHDKFIIEWFVQNITKKANILLELFKNIATGPVSQEITSLNTNNNERNEKLLKIIEEKNKLINDRVKEFSNRLIEKLKNDENNLLFNIKCQFSKIEERINYYNKTSKDINSKIDEWKKKVEEKMNLLYSIEDLKANFSLFLDYKEAIFDKLVYEGNNIINDVQNANNFPTEELIDDISKLDISVDNKIFSNVFFNLNNKLDLSEILLKYDVPSSFNSDEDLRKSIAKLVNKAIFNSSKDTEFIEDIKSTNSIITEQSNILKEGNTNIIDDESKYINNMSNIYSHDSSISSIQNSNEKQKKYKSLIGNDKKKEKMNKRYIIDSNKTKRSKRSNIHNTKHRRDLSDSDISDLSKEKYKRYNLVSKSVNELSNKKNLYKLPKSTKSFVLEDNKISKYRKQNKSALNKSNNSKYLSKSPISRNKRCLLPNDRSVKSQLFKKEKDISAFNSNNDNKLNKIKKLIGQKFDVINLSRQNLGDEGAIILSNCLYTSIEKLNEIKLVKNNISDDGLQAILRALETSIKIKTINLAQNSITDKSADCIIKFLAKSKSISTIYLTTNKFSSTVKEKIIKSVIKKKITVII